MTANDLKGPRRVELRLLLGRQPLAQQSNTPGFPDSFGRPAALAQGQEPVHPNRQPAPRVTRHRSQRDADGAHPPTSRGKNSVSPAVGSKDRVTVTVPASSRLAAVKPTAVKALKRRSALASASRSLASKWCLVSPV